MTFANANKTIFFLVIGDWPIDDDEIEIDHFVVNYKEEGVSSNVVAEDQPMLIDLVEKEGEMEVESKLFKKKRTMNKRGYVKMCCLLM